MGKGKQSVPADQTVVQSNLPKYVRPYFERLLDRTEAESLRDYETYEGQRLAGEAQDTLDSRQRARDVAGTPIAGLPAAQAATTAGVGRALQGMGFEAGQFDSAAADQYMSPYMQQVVDVQKERAILDAQRQGAGRGAQAVQAGAFGGSRAAVQEALAGEALNRQLAEIQASGQQQAFEQAQQQFERDRAARADAERIGLGAGELAGQQARSLADLGRLAREGDIESARLLEQVGKDITTREQAGLDLAYQDFVRQRDFPRENLQFLSSILRGVPITPSTETTTMQAYNPIQQLLGTGISALGLYKGLGG
tara:strand:+ start:418 stop:1347 length:930 start_codon:yes stop_codon:yes gene_type:complete